MLVNLTPHTVRIHNQDGSIVEVPPSGRSVRVETKDTLYGSECGCDCYVPQYDGEMMVVGFDGSEEPYRGQFDSKDDLHIVSALVARHVSQSTYLGLRVASPGASVRDDKGITVGCLGLRILNPSGSIT